MPKEISQQRIVKVAVPCPLYKTFDYLLPLEAYEQVIQPGMRVRVPFGRQKLIGIILEEITNSDVPANKLKSLIALLDNHNLLGADVLKLLFWAARYYVHPLGDVFQTALPVYLRNNDDATPSLTDYWYINHSQQSTLDEIQQHLKRAPKQQQVYQLSASTNN